MFKVPEKYRFFRKNSRFSTTTSNGNNGVFVIPHYRISNYVFIVFASDGKDWEHLSIEVMPKEKAKKDKLPKRCATWEEMSYIKSLFWSEEDVVIQYHPAKSEYVNLHPYVLHLWRPIKEKIPVPDIQLV
jgi:hypothetical protein